MGNVRSFPNRSSLSSATQGSWAMRLLMVGLYLSLGFLLRNSGSGGAGFNVFLLLGIFYWVFIQRQVIKTSYFCRFHYLQACLLFLMIYLTGLILSVALGAISSLLSLAALNGILGSVMSEVSHGFQMLVFYGCPLLGISQAVMALLGKTPRLPWVTPNVLYYV